jgi:hypothetical protein
MQGWLDETAESLKSLDPNHLVTYSSEGFLGSSTPGETPATATACSATSSHDAIMRLPAAAAPSAPIAAARARRLLDPDATASQQLCSALPT